MNAFCVLFSDMTDNSEMSELSRLRTLASVPFGGRFRLVDFMLSSLVAAKVQSIGIVTRNKYGSLMDHVGWGKDWDLNRKNGGIKFLTPFLEDADMGFGDNKFETLNSIMAYIKNQLPEYCVICDSNVVFNFDFDDFMNYHNEKNADITFVYKKEKPRKNDLECMFDGDGRLVDTLYNTYSKDEEKNIEMNIILMKKELLVYIVEQAMTYGWRNFKRDIFAKQCNDLRIFGYEEKNYCSIIRSVNDYYNASMDLLSSAVRKELFYKETPILTRIKDSVPAIYGENCNVKNSLVADGCTVDGEVENCILFRDVKIEKGAVVKNSIIMQNSVIESGSVISYVITDKNVKITRNNILAGTETMPFIVNKGKIV